jgi:hypothetical protein
MRWLVAIAFLVGCEGGKGGGACEFGGETHQIGETFPAGDGCNSCHCDEDGEVSCTLLECIDATAATCKLRQRRVRVRLRVGVHRRRRLRRRRSDRR